MRTHVWAHALYHRKESRFPITDHLLTVLNRHKRARLDDCDFVFHIEGEAIARRLFHKAWTAAREAAELPTLIPHDLRRSAVRQLERARVPRQVAMRLVGHRTDSIYRRFAIVSEADVHAAGASLDALHSTGSIVTKSLQSKQPAGSRRAKSRKNT